eukprot:scaffold1102_cov195-Alexandrium_tamarense.AAC.28
MTMMTENLIEGWNSADAFACREIAILGPNQTLIVQHNADSYCRDREKASMYKTILKASLNLKDEQVQQSIDELGTSCPLEAEALHCNNPVPDITKERHEHRG